MRARLADPAEPALRERWQELAGRAVEPNPFFEPASVLPSVDLLAGGSQVRLLVVEDGGALQLLLPVRRERVARLPLRAATSWQHEYCFAGAPLLSADAPVEAWAVALRALAAATGAHLLALPRLPLDGPAARALAGALPPGARLGTTHRFDRPYVHRRADGSYLDATLGSRSRKALRRHRRRLAEVLGAEVEVGDAAADPAQLQSAVEQLLDVEGRGWKGAAGTAMASRAEHAEHFRRLCAGFAAEGRLQVFRLGVAGRPAALQANLVAGRTVFHYKTTYDEDLAAFSPGLQLEVAMVEEFHRDTRLEHLDPCTDPGPTVSERLYPDRCRLGTVLVPLDGVGRVAARAAPQALAAARAGRAALARGAARRGAAVQAVRAPTARYGPQRRPTDGGGA